MISEQSITDQTLIQQFNLTNHLDHMYPSRLMKHTQKIFGEYMKQVGTGGSHPSLKEKLGI